MTDTHHEKPEYCPTQSGSFTAYEPQWLHPADGWTRIPTTSGTYGVPYPALTGGVLQTIDLYSQHQALSLAHAFAAMREADGNLPTVRIQPYRVHYDIKAKKMDEDKERTP